MSEEAPKQEHAEIIVLKFGSSVLRTDADLLNAVHEVYRWVRKGYRVVAVVSAIGEATDQLLGRARALSSTPESFATAELLATGERSSAALLGIALDRVGIPARVLNPREIGLTVVGNPVDSELAAVGRERLRRLLAEHAVLACPGFFGTDAAGRTHLLGRGGSDLSAVFLAHALGARCRLIKDVDGVYESDPALAVGARRFAELTYADALRVAGPLIQPKAVSYLQRHGGQAEVAGLALPYQSVVHAGRTALAEAISHPPLSVLLLGLGTVGFGVYQGLRADPRHFSVLGALVRDREKYAALGIAGRLLHVGYDSLRSLRPDLVVDALPRIEPSRQLVEHFLATGTDVVSANKALVAEYGVPLTALAERSGASLSYSAAVGGSTPMIEFAARTAAHAPIRSIAGVLNGTCNFVLDRCVGGATWDHALAEARRQGFAEQDATEDLSGRDAERKLRILARHAFSDELSDVAVEALTEAAAEQARNAAAAGVRLRQVAAAWRECDGVLGAVKLERFPSASALGGLSGEWNGLEITHEDAGAITVTGRGAGRWPTTEAVMADLFDALRRRVGP